MNTISEIITFVSKQDDTTIYFVVFFILLLTMFPWSTKDD